MARSTFGRERHGLIHDDIKRSGQGRSALLSLAILGLIASVLAGCGGGSASGNVSARGERAALVSYLQQVEPIRLAVNRLLEGADPILSAYRDSRISPWQASLRMGVLEQRFAAYTVDIAALEPATAQLRSLNAPYAHTYILEDAYLSALVTGLAERKLDGLPDTQAAQRAAIIQWRTGLALLARRAAVHLPGDLQAAGRGEIAPSPGGS
ncbi:MAG TPA: hypothetical protein VES65_01760 [Solirubrobacteraceae bacterium]|nr:hypothetical protein [Solirubrobacteraceae bacterium]